MKKNILHPLTEATNQAQKNKSTHDRFIALAWLAKQFPKAFDNRYQIRPLKRGIMQDVLAHAALAATAGISKSKLRQAVVLFTRRVDYLVALKAREIRVDLEGRPTEPVTEEEALDAAMKLKRRTERNAHQARLSQQAKPNRQPKSYYKRPIFNGPSSQASSAIQATADVKRTAGPAVIVKRKPRLLA